jgi:peptidoglycan/xylan/chitin deacetylase (PgdA/CDA1 family)
MIIYDAIHGYQPFSEEMKQDWVQRNLEEVFLPTSEAMRQATLKRAVQLQGCTIQEWLRDHDTRAGAQKVLDNLRMAANRGNIDVGCSAFSHPILPLLSEESIYAQIKLDQEIVEQHIGKCTWFWPPEGAMDTKTIQVLAMRFPELLVTIPNRCVPRIKTSTFVKIKGGKKMMNAAVFNVLVKDTLMNAASYKKKPAYMPKGMRWKYSACFMRDAESLRKLLMNIDRNKEHAHLIFRDWENAESKEALVQMMPNSKEISAFAKLAWMHDGEFKQLSKRRAAAKTVNIKDIKPGSWEPTATAKDPYPFWTPQKPDKRHRPMLEGWKKIYQIYDEAFTQMVRRATGNSHKKMSLGQRLEATEQALQNPLIKEAYLQTSMALISCIPWHMMANEKWEHDAGFTYRAMHRMVKVKMHHFLNFCHEHDYLSSEETAKHKQEVDRIAALYAHQ